MNKASGNTAASSQDTQRQMQGQPTAAQEAQGGRSRRETTIAEPTALASSVTKGGHVWPPSPYEKHLERELYLLTRVCSG
jgi:hypothetical protein